LLGANIVVDCHPCSVAIQYTNDQKLPTQRYPILLRDWLESRDSGETCRPSGGASRCPECSMLPSRHERAWLEAAQALGEEPEGTSNSRPLGRVSQRKLAPHLLL